LRSKNLKTSSQKNFTGKLLTVRRVTYLIVILFLAESSFGQRIADYRFNLGFTKAEKGVSHAELGFNRDLFNFLDNDLRLGFGVRLGVQDNVDITFLTARDDLKDRSEAIDTLRFDRVQSASFNLYAQAEYYVLSWLSGGVNLDLVGITAGSEVEGRYGPGAESISSGYIAETDVNSRPTKANAFSFGSQKGSLVSQIYARFEPSEQIAIKLGYSFVLTEYSTLETKGANQQFRFENNTGGVFIGLSFNKFDNK